LFSLIAGLSAQTLNVAISGGNQTAVAGTEFGSPISVLVTQFNNQPAAGVSVTITLPPAGGEPSATFALGARTVTLTTNAQGIATTSPMGANNAVGSYTGTVTVNGKTTNFQLTNTGYAAPTVAPDSLIFTMNLGDPAPAPQTVVISSPTDGYTATADSAFIKLTLRSNAVLVVAVDPTGLTAGRYQGFITVNGQTVIPVTLIITARPQLFSLATSAGLTFTYIQFTPRGTAQPLDQFVTVWSSQANFPVVVDETYTSPVNGKWLAAASKKGTVTPVNLEVVVDPTGLTPGTYQGNIRVSAPDASNSPLLLPVTLIVKRFPNARAPELESLTNGASLQDGAISSGALASLSANNLNCTSDPVISLDGTAVQNVSGKDGRMNFIVPDLSGRNRSQVQISCDGQSSTPYSIGVAAAAPGFFTNGDGTAVADTTTVGGRRAVRLFGTGFGTMTTGDSGNQIPALPVRVWMGGVQGMVMSVSPSADLPGVMEIVVLVPDTVDPGSTVSLDVLFDDAAAQSGLKIAINQ
jgi:uncharacterized protein (TIGR03437 family)